MVVSRRRLVVLSDVAGTSRSRRSLPPAIRCRRFSFPSTALHWEKVVAWNKVFFEAVLRRMCPLLGCQHSGDLATENDLFQ